MMLKINFYFDPPFPNNRQKFDAGAGHFGCLDQEPGYARTTAPRSVPVYAGAGV